MSEPRHWHPDRWDSLGSVARVRGGDIIHNPVYSARSLEGERKARELAAELDTALAARGFRIDYPACVVGVVVALSKDK